MRVDIAVLDPDLRGTIVRRDRGILVEWRPLPAAGTLREIPAAESGRRSTSEATRQLVVAGSCESSYRPARLLSFEP
jgi:hypothetical protein